MTLLTTIIWWQRTDMKTRIADFLAGKKQVSANTIKSYSYDLNQFCQLVDNQLSPTGLQLYEAWLQGLKPSAQKRKLSAVNQFLLYLYEEGAVPDFYRLTLTVRLDREAANSECLDLSPLWQETDQKEGQLLALLISQLGLTPSEILAIQQTDVDLTFEVVRIRKGHQVRILSLPKPLLPYLESSAGQVYLFDHGGQAYSRQWLGQTLKAYLTSLGLGGLSPKSLRDQYLLNQVASGLSIWDLAKQLGLKTTATLEKYYNNGH